MTYEPENEIDVELEQMLVDDLVGQVDDSEVSADAISKVTPGGLADSNNRQQIAQAEIDDLGDFLDIPASSRQMAESLFNQYVSQSDITGNAIEVLAAACLYIACKVDSEAPKPDAFAAVEDTAFSRNLLLRRSKTIASTLGLNPESFLDPTQYVDRFCGELELDESLRKRATEIIETVEKQGGSAGKSPTGLAAAAIYNSCIEADIQVTQSEISEVADVSEVTIRNRYKEQREYLSYTATQSLDNTSLQKSESDGEYQSKFDGEHTFQVYEIERALDATLSHIDAGEALQKKTEEIWTTVRRRGILTRIDTEELNVALAIIRCASEAVDQKVRYSILRATTDEQTSSISSTARELEKWL